MSNKKALVYLSNNIERDLDALFPSALVLSSLALVGGLATKIKQDLAEKLLAERGVLSTYNYWVKSSSMRSCEGYPNDLDDTCCAWIGLTKYEPSLMDEKTFFELLKVFSYCYDIETNQYQTWVVCKQNSLWLDFDLGVNINVLRFFNYYGFKPKQTHIALDLAISSGKLDSVYYCGELPLIYFLSDFYHGVGLGLLRQKIESVIAIKQNDPALIIVVIAALRFGFTDLVTSELVKQVRSMQRSDGSYPIFPFYYYQCDNIKSNYYFNDLISTGFYLEFEALLEDSLVKKEKKRQKGKLIRFVKKSLTQIGQVNLEQKLLSKAKQIIEADSSELLIFLADRLYADLGCNRKDAVDLSLLASLQVFANLAYKIYDDINDEGKNTILLPWANMSIYLLFQQMLLLVKPLVYQKQLVCYLLAIEKNFCFEKDRLSLRKSIWQAVDELDESELHQITSEKVKAAAFSSYLLLDLLETTDKEVIAKIINLVFLVKQLNDDLHDCFTDLKNQQLNSTNYYLLKEIAKDKNKNRLLNNDHQLRKIFYNKVLFMVQAMILKSIQEAQSLLKTQNSLNHNGFFRKILCSYERLLIVEVRRANVIQYLLLRSTKINNEDFTFVQ